MTYFHSVSEWKASVSDTRKGIVKYITPSHMNGDCLMLYISRQHPHNILETLNSWLEWFLTTDKTKIYINSLGVMYAH